MGVLFQPGVSGNPGGRPKMPAELREAARAASLEALQFLIAVIKDESARTAERITAANAVLDRAYGKPAQAVAGEDGEGPAELVVRWARPGE